MPKLLQSVVMLTTTYIYTVSEISGPPCFKKA